MADINIIGFVSRIKYIKESILVFVDEFQRGYKKPDGTYVDDKYITWMCIFRNGMSSYINKYFNDGMLVQIKGTVLPYAIEHEKIVDGCSVIGQTIVQYSYPRSMAKKEYRMIKESQENSDATPDLEGYNQEDF